MGEGKRQMKSIYVVTGPRGSGKSTAVARFAKPSELSKMVVVDTEDSMSDIIKNNEALGYQFGAYIRMYDRFKIDQDLLDAIAKGKLPWVSAQQKSALLGYYEFFVHEINSVLEKGKYEFLGIDTVEPIEAAMATWAETNRQASGWSGKRAYGGLEVEAIRPLYENLFEGIARRGVKNIILASHLKRVWEEDKPILNKVQPGGRLVLLSRISTAMFWLVAGAGNTDGAPAAIVLKARKATETVSNDEWVIKRILPERIPHFTWQDVRGYETTGCDLRNPKPGETITEAEREMISEFLTDEQMKLMVLGAEMELEGMKIETIVSPQQTNGFEPKREDSRLAERIKGMKVEGLGLKTIADTLGISLGEVLKASKP